jgi:hypothetical protein
VLSISGEGENGVDMIIVIGFLRTLPFLLFFPSLRLLNLIVLASPAKYSIRVHAIHCVQVPYFYVGIERPDSHKLPLKPFLLSLYRPVYLAILHRVVWPVA